MRNQWTFFLLASVWIGFATCGGATASEPSEPAPADAQVDYGRDIKPILRERCFACHGALKQEASLRLDAASWIRAGGDSGDVLGSGNVADSYLLERIMAADESERMPPEGPPLDAAQQSLFKQWIASDAPMPDDDEPEPSPTEHWAFQTLRAVSVPHIQQRPQHFAVRNPIDAFIAAGYERQQLVPMPTADRKLLLRRLYLDLIGLPPTPDELAAFLADPRPDAYERVVDRLLARPEYAERWGRHWMDVWRYSDWFGLGEQLRYSQKHIWHWRDWILESLAADKGYDRMVMEMLAGDELAPNDPSTLRATGFLARNYFLFNRTTWLDDTIEHTGKAFLALTMNCAKCHDHKYDPISQHDYYAFRAILEPHQIRLDVRPGIPDLTRDGIPRAFDAHPDAVTHIHRRGDPAQPDTSSVIPPSVPAFLCPDDWKVSAIPLAVTAWRPQEQAFFWADLLGEASRELSAARAELARLQPASLTQPVSTRSNVTDADETADPSPSDQPVVGAEMTAPRLAAVRVRHAATRVAMLAAVENVERRGGETVDANAVRAAALATRRWELAQKQWELAKLLYEQQKQTADDSERAQRIGQIQDQVREATAKLDDPGDAYFSPRASEKALEGPDETAESRYAEYPALSTGRRLALARWIASSDNPLTARVAVNHIWLRHFGLPLVDPVEDFGRRTPAPVHQDLLDWLALRLIKADWQMKPIHRLLVTSQTYRLACADRSADESTLRQDGENRFFWCRSPQRMQAQVIRDSMLHLAGQLESQLGGPTVDPRQDSAPYRRSLYFTHSRDDQHAFLQMFDDADILRCYQRQQSVVPQQALALANSQLALEMSGAIAARITAGLDHEQQASLAPASASASTDSWWNDFVDASYQWILCRAPTDAERALCREAIQRWLDGQPDEADAAGATSPHVRASRNLVHALMNANDFVTVR